MNITIHGAGYKLPGRDDGLFKCVYNKEHVAWLDVVLLQRYAATCRYLQKT